MAPNQLRGYSGSYPKVDAYLLYVLADTLPRAGAAPNQDRGFLYVGRGAVDFQALHEWLLAQRPRITDATATARDIDYSLKRWTAWTRYLDDAALPIDNNFDEQQIRPWATGRKNWLFAGTLMAGQRAAAIMCLIQSAKRACAKDGPR